MLAAIVMFGTCCHALGRADEDQPPKQLHTQCLQALPDFHSQGKHYACGHGKDVFPEREVYGLAEMYEQQGKPLTILQLANKVHYLFCPYHLSKNLLFFEN
jgi:hypothetical protein